MRPATRLLIRTDQPSTVTRLVLILVFAAFAWTAFRSAAVEAPDLAVSALAFAVLLFLLRPFEAPPLERRIRLPLAILILWAALQLLPLRLAVIGWISPARAEIARALGHSFSPVSAFPAGGFWEWLRVAGSVLVFLIVRELAWRLSAHRTPWMAVLPLVAVAVLEAALGLVQFYTGAANSGAHGTYTNRDHFAGLLEMALPFPVMYGIASLRRGQTRFHTPVRPVLTACAAFGAAAVLLLGSIHSLSRMGFIAALLALAILAASRVRRKRWLLAFPAAGLMLLLYLPPNELIARFAEISTPDKIASQDRVNVWSQTLPLIAAYPLTGCGLGAYESVFMRYKLTTPLATDNYAHNDYLQYAAELGIPAALLGIALIAAVFSAAVRAAANHSSPSGRALAVASMASMSALLLHSTVDFNSYIPGNSFAFAWVAAIAVSAGFSSQPAPQSGPVTIEAVPV